MGDLFENDGLLLWLTIGGVIILIVMLFVIRAGVKASRSDALMAAPPPEDLNDIAAGERVAILPERPDVVVENAPSVLNPDRPKDDAITGGLNKREIAPETGAEKPADAADISQQPSPWGGGAKIGDLESESSYTDDEMMAREIKAMLLQDRPDRAITHVMAAKKVDEAEAVRIVKGYTDQGQG